MKRDYSVLINCCYVDNALKIQWEDKIKKLNFKGKGDVYLHLSSKKNEYWASYNGDIKVEVSDHYSVTISDTVSFEELKQYLLENGCLEESAVKLNEKIKCNSGCSIICSKEHEKEGCTLMDQMRSLIFKNVNTVNIKASDEKEIKIDVFPRFYAIRVYALSDFETVKQQLYDKGVLEKSPYPIDKSLMKQETFYASLEISYDMDVFELYEKFAEPLNEILKENKIGYVDGNELGFGATLFITIKNNKPATIKRLVKIIKDFAKTHPFPAKTELVFEGEKYKI